MKKKITAFLLAVLLIMMFATTAYAEDTTTTGEGTITTTIPVEGSIDALDISVTHPSSVQYTINPNSGSTTTLISPDIMLTNNSAVNVSVTVQSFASCAGGTLQFTDVAEYDAYDWANLNKADSKNYMHMVLSNTGLQAGGWAVKSGNGNFVAGAAGPIYLGQIAPAGVAEILLSCKHGLAFDQAYTAQHEIVFVFSIS